MEVSSIILSPIRLQEDYSDIPVDSPTPQSYLFRDHLQYMIPLIQGFSRNEESRSWVYEVSICNQAEKRQSQWGKPFDTVMPLKLQRKSQTKRKPTLILTQNMKDSNLQDSAGFQKWFSKARWHIDPAVGYWFYL